MLIKMNTIRRYSWRNVDGIFRAKEGVSAVEFALIAPLMMLIYFGCVELSLMMVVDRKVTTSTATLGDLTARASVITDADLADIFQATRMIFQPYNTTNAHMRVSSLYDDKGTIKVAWSDGFNKAPYPKNQVIAVPANLVPAGGTVIFAEIEYDYKSSLGYFFSTTRKLNDKFYLRPRRVNEIERVKN